MSDRAAVFIDELSEKIRPLIALVEELHSIDLESVGNIKLQSIVVVGEQSTGMYL